MSGNSSPTASQVSDDIAANDGIKPRSQSSAVLTRSHNHTMKEVETMAFKNNPAKKDPNNMNWNRLRTKVFVEYILLVDFYLCVCWVACLTLNMYAYYFETGIDYNYSFETVTRVLLYLVSMLAGIMVILSIIRKIFLYRLTSFRASTNLMREVVTMFAVELPMEILVIITNPIPSYINSRRFSFTAIDYYETSLTYIDNDLLQIFAIFKLYIFVRAILSRTIYYSDRAYRICQIFNFEMNYQFVIKCLMRHSPFAVSLVWLAVGVLFFGHAIRITEKPLRMATDRMDHSPVSFCFWEAFITMATVGYGDFYPRTNKGRVVMVCCCLYGVLNFSLIVVSVTNFLRMSLREENSYHLIKRVSLKKEMKILASDIMGKAAAYVGTKKNDPKQSDRVLQKLQDVYSKFESVNETYKETIGERNIEEKIQMGFSDMDKGLSQLKQDAEELCRELGLDPVAILKAERLRLVNQQKLRAQEESKKNRAA